MKTALFPGSFDPITKAHEDLILRATKIFDKVIVAIGINPSKKHFLSLKLRKKMLENVFENNPQIEITTYESLTIELCTQKQIKYLLRGIRSVSDFEYEGPIAQVNQIMKPEVETLFILSRVEFIPFSSTIVRELLKYRADVARFIPHKALDVLRGKKII